MDDFQSSPKTAQVCAPLKPQKRNVFIMLKNSSRSKQEFIENLRANIFQTMHHIIRKK